MPVPIRLAGPWVAGLLLLSTAPAQAELSKSFQLTATIANGCSVATTGTGTWGDIDLGTVNSISTGSVSANLTSNGSAGMQLNCTPGTTVQVSADNGNQPVGGVRQLANGTSKVPYQIYANGSATPWTTQTIGLTFSAGTSLQSLPVKATATLAPPMKAGAYSDTVHVTLSW
jgi:spore coat protein U-like protein